MFDFKPNYPSRPKFSINFPDDCMKSTPPENRFHANFEIDINGFRA